jgi:hypothetical protein
MAPYPGLFSSASQQLENEARRADTCLMFLQPYQDTFKGQSKLPHSKGRKGKQVFVKVYMLRGIQ